MLIKELFSRAVMKMGASRSTPSAATECTSAGEGVQHTAVARGLDGE